MNLISSTYFCNSSPIICLLRFSLAIGFPCFASLLVRDSLRLYLRYFQILNIRTLDPQNWVAMLWFTGPHVYLAVNLGAMFSIHRILTFCMTTSYCLYTAINFLSAVIRNYSKSSIRLYVCKCVLYNQQLKLKI